MAGAKPGVHIVQLKRVQVPKFMIEGEKFVKWDEVSYLVPSYAHPVIIVVGKCGYLFSEQTSLCFLTGVYSADWKIICCDSKRHN